MKAAFRTFGSVLSILLLVGMFLVPTPAAAGGGWDVPCIGDCPDQYCNIVLGCSRNNWVAGICGGEDARCYYTPPSCGVLLKPCGEVIE